VEPTCSVEAELWSKVAAAIQSSDSAKLDTVKMVLFNMLNSCLMMIRCGHYGSVFIGRCKEKKPAASTKAAKRY